MSTRRVIDSIVGKTHGKKWLHRLCLGFSEGSSSCVASKCPDDEKSSSPESKEFFIL